MLLTYQTHDLDNQWNTYQMIYWNIRMQLMVLKILCPIGTMLRATLPETQQVLI